MEAIINKIIDFSNVDGPSNRTAIFFQGCNFRCWYCHNPETINVCCDCGICVPTCPSGALTLTNGKVNYQVDRCIDCDTCLKVCPYSSSPKVQVMTVEDMMQVIEKNQPFIDGITVSGGECMLYPQLLTELFMRCRPLGLTCLIDSNGSIDFSLYPLLMEVCDGVMLDVKAVDEQFHHQLTGQSNHMVLKNLDYLLSINKLQEVRTVMLNHQSEQNEKTLRFVINKLANRAVYRINRYRPFGVSHEYLEYLSLQIVDEQEIERLVAIAKTLHTELVII
jgi:pyruvate formate lyase activating enzyme